MIPEHELKKYEVHRWAQIKTPIMQEAVHSIGGLFAVVAEQGHNGLPGHFFEGMWQIERAHKSKLQDLNMQLMQEAVEMQTSAANLHYTMAAEYAQLEFDKWQQELFLELDKEFQWEKSQVQLQALEIRDRSIENDLRRIIIEEAKKNIALEYEALNRQLIAPKTAVLSKETELVAAQWETLQKKLQIIPMLEQYVDKQYLLLSKEGQVVDARFAVLPYKINMAEMDQQIADKDVQIALARVAIANRMVGIYSMEAVTAMLHKQAVALEYGIFDLRDQLTDRQYDVLAKRLEVIQKELQLIQMEEVLRSKESEVLSKEEAVLNKETERVAKEGELITAEGQTMAKAVQVLGKEQSLLSKEAEVLNKKAWLLGRETILLASEQQTAAKDAQVIAKELELLQAQTGTIAAKVVVMGKEVTLLAQEGVTIQKEGEVLQKQATLLTKEKAVLVKEGAVLSKDADLLAAEKLTHAKEPQVLSKEVELMSQEITTLGKEVTLLNREVDLVSKEQVTVGKEESLINAKVANIALERNIITAETSLNVQRGLYYDAQDALIVAKDAYLAAVEALWPEYQKVITAEQNLRTAETQKHQSYRNLLSKMRDAITLENNLMTAVGATIQAEGLLNTQKLAWYNKLKSLLPKKQSLITEKGVVQSETGNLSVEEQKIALKDTTQVLPAVQNRILALEALIAAQITAIEEEKRFLGNQIKRALLAKDRALADQAIDTARINMIRARNKLSLLDLDIQIAEQDGRFAVDAERVDQAMQTATLREDTITTRIDDEEAAVTADHNRILASEKSRVEVRLETGTDIADQRRSTDNTIASERVKVKKAEHNAQIKAKITQNLTHLLGSTS